MKFLYINFLSSKYWISKFVTVCGYNTKNGENVIPFQSWKSESKMLLTSASVITNISLSHALCPTSSPGPSSRRFFINGGSSGVTSGFSKPAAVVGLNGEGGRKWKRKGNKTPLLQFPLSIPISPICAFYAMVSFADLRLGVLFSLRTEAKNAWPKAELTERKSFEIYSLNWKTTL